MKSETRILLLEDDADLGSTILEVLESAGYRVDLARDGAQAADFSYETAYDLYIFDINVPEINGIELLKDLRNASDNTPAIYITALSDLNTLSKAFEAGAEAYLKKPFLPEELLIRVDARLKKSVNESITYGDIVYYPATKELFKDQKIVSLGAVQLKIFDALVHNVDKVVSKEDLIELLEQPSGTALRVAITKLKQKLGINIINVRGVGYTLEEL